MPKINRLDRLVERADIEERIDNDLFPITSVVYIYPGYHTNSSNGGYTPVFGSSTSQIKQWLSDNYPQWYLCDGTAPNDPESPVFNTSSKQVPQLTNLRFLRGTTSAGSGATSTNNKKLSISQMQVHSHGRGNLVTNTMNANHGHNSGSVKDLSTHYHEQWGWSSQGGINASLYTSHLSKNIDRASKLLYSANVTWEDNHTHNTNNTSHSHSGNANTGETGNAAPFATTPTYLSSFYVIRIK